MRSTDPHTIELWSLNSISERTRNIKKTHLASDKEISGLLEELNKLISKYIHFIELDLSEKYQISQ